MNTRSIHRPLLIACLLVLAITLVPTSMALAGTTGGENDFYGTVQALPSTSNFVGDWQVNNRTVHVSASTLIKSEDRAKMQVGAYVEVEGIPQPDGSINATKIELESEAHDTTKHAKFIGVIKSLPASGLIGDWTIAGQMMTQTVTINVHVTTRTRIKQDDGTVQVGATVSVEGIKQTDGSIDAGEIEVKKGKPTVGSEIEMLGKIEALPGSGMVGDWKVNAVTVHVTSTTKIEQEHGKVQLGAIVRVEGILQSDGSINAKEIEVRSNPNGLPAPTKFSKFYGVVQTLPAAGVIGDWKIGGVTVHVSTTTKVEYGPAVVGSMVEVKGVLQNDGSLNAVKIEVKNAGSKPSSLFGQTSALAKLGQ